MCSVEFRSSTLIAHDGAIGELNAAMHALSKTEIMGHRHHNFAACVDFDGESSSRQFVARYLCL
jgi:hypothetical protein